jgi:hypothetical protein
VYDRPHMVSSASKNLFSAPSICLCAKPYWTARAESSHSSHIKHLLIYRGAARSVATAPLAGIKPEQRGRAPLCCRWNKCRWNTHACAPCQYRPRREPDEAARGAPAGAGPDCSAEAAAEIGLFRFCRRTIRRMPRPGGRFRRIAVSTRLSCWGRQAREGRLGLTPWHSNGVTRRRNVHARMTVPAS